MILTKEEQDRMIAEREIVNASTPEYQLGKLMERVCQLEKAMADAKAIDARRSSIELGTPAKGGSIKLYIDPGASAEENDRLLAEEVRLYVNAGGIGLAVDERIMKMAKAKNDEAVRASVSESKAV